MDRQKQLELARQILEQNNVSATGTTSSLADRWNAQTTQVSEPKRDGIIKSIAKDVAGTLLVKPAARATEAIVRTVAPESQIAKGYEALNAEGGQQIAGIDVSQKAFGEGGGKQIAGEALKTASYLFPYGKVAGGIGAATGSKVAGNIASGALGGYTADVGYGLADGQPMEEALKPGLGTVLGTVIPAAAPLTRATGRAIAKVGEKAVEAVIPTSSREATILQTYKANNPFFKRVADVLKGTENAPTTAGKTATRTSAGQSISGLFGTKSQIGVQAKRAKDALWSDVIKPRLQASDQAVDLDGFFNKVQEDIIAKNPELSRQKSLLEALDAVKEDYAGTKAVSLEGLQKLKEGWAKFVPDKAYQGKPIAGAFNDVRNQLADEARQTIYSQLGDDVKQAYFDYGNLQGLTEMGKVSMTGQKLKGGTGGLVSEILSQTLTPIGTVGGQAVYRLGKGIEFIGNLGAKNLGEALGVNLKFPGDAAIDDISKTVKKAKSLPNKQGGFIKLGQDAKAPMATQANQTTRMTPNTSNIPKSSPKSAPKSIDPLINEAKKYKSAEEFVKAQGTHVYHGTNAEFDKFDISKATNTQYGKGIYFTENPKITKQYGKKTIEVYLDKNSVLKLNEPLSIEQKNNLRRVIGKDEWDWSKNPTGEFVWNRLELTHKNPEELLRKAGIKGVQHNQQTVNGTNKNFVIFDESAIRTKSQLTDIWNKANKSQPLQEGVNPLIQEAKKYKSAEEFVKAQGNMQFVHNLSPEQIIKANEIGGLPAPSIATVNPNKTDFTRFGEISLIPKKSVIDGQKTVLSDAYTQTFGNIDKLPDNISTKKGAEWIDNAMQKEWGAGAKTPSGFVRSQLVEEVNSIADIQKNISKLTSKSYGDKIKADIDYAIHSLAERINKNPNDLIETRKSRNIINDAILGKTDGLSQDIISEVNKLRQKIIKAPTEYFETKIGRNVGLDEFSHALVPKGTSLDVIKVLKDKGVIVIEKTGKNDLSKLTKSQLEEIWKKANKK